MGRQSYPNVSDPVNMHRCTHAELTDSSRDPELSGHNSRVWAEENPLATFVTLHQVRFSVNMWAGIVHDDLVGQYMLPARLDDRVYQLLVQYTLPKLLEDAQLMTRDRMGIQRDGVSPHNARAVREYLDQGRPCRLACSLPRSVTPTLLPVGIALSMRYRWTQQENS
ncbi:hypothetical protein PR048_028749 [Dryococelus australis]|uniref:Transposase n=1 Tax=Dryococelus australis TaxID=614101 RepID=A0ABQ9GDY6_9NEOP|nr:hypothetical protein PR048_028749 [Dryococelus australis]